MPSSKADPRLDIPPPRAPLRQAPEPTAWQQVLARAAEAWAMYLGAPVPPSLPR